jgi:hypothetical protein
MKRSSTIALCFSSAALLFGMGGVMAPPKHVSRASLSPAAPLNSPLSGAIGMPPLGNAEPLTIVSRPERDTPRFALMDFRQIPGGERFEAVSLNERGEVLGLQVAPDRSLEGPGMGYVSNRVQMIAGASWSLFRQGAFIPVVQDAPEGYLHTAAQNDRGQILLMTGPRGRRGRVEPRQGDLSFQMWENGVLKPVTIADDVRREIGREATTGMLALNNRGQAIVSSGRDILTWEQGHIRRLDFRYILGFNNHGYTVGNPLVFDPGTGRSDVALNAVMTDVATGASRSLESGKDIVFDLNDRNQTLCSLRRSHLGADRDRFYVLSGKKQTPLAVIGGAITARMNNRGQAVLGKYLWNEGKLYDLETLVPLGSPWKFQYVLDINDRGEILIRAFNVVERLPRSLLLRPITRPENDTAIKRVAVSRRKV